MSRWLLARAVVGMLLFFGALWAAWLRQWGPASCLLMLMMWIEPGHAELAASKRNTH